jgi:AraC-like DNA-binding protein
MKIGMSLFVKLLITFFLLLIIPINVISTTVYYNALSYFEKEISATNTEKLLATQGLMETLMDSVVKDAKNIGLNKSIENIGQLGGDPSQAYSGLNLPKMEEVFQILYNARIANSNIHSIYLYNYNDNNIYTSDKLFVKSDQFYDTDWIDKYNLIKQGLVWLDTRESGIPITAESSAVNSMAGQRKVITLVYPIQYISSFNGLVAINVLEGELSKAIGRSETSEMGEIKVINRQGMVITSSSRGMAGSNLSGRSDIREILNSGETQGMVTAEINHAKYLITYVKSDLTGWTFINEYSFEKIVSRVNTYRNFVVIISILMTLLGIPVCFYISRKLYNPVKKLVDDIRSQKGISASQSRNEMVVISNALNDVLRQGSQIRGLMERNQKNLTESYLLSIIRGDADIEVPYVSFTETRFMCAIIAIDNYNSFVRKNSDDGRHFTKEIILKVCENMLNTRWKCAGVQFEKGKIALILNVPEEQESELVADIAGFFGEIKKKVYEVLENTVTIAIGNCYAGKEKVEQSFSEAKDVLKYRMMYGCDKIITAWENGNETAAEYYYPTAVENHIFNYLKLGMKKELSDSMDEFVKEIREMNLSYDNIIQIVNQFIGNIVKHMLNVRLNPSEVFPGNTTMYQYASALETLDEIKVWIRNILYSVIDYIEIRDSSENKYIQQIQSYIQRNYKEEINFEKLAQSVGISYSHMRKLFRDKLDTSVLDYINSIRIDNAKRLLKGTELTIQDIATKVGYQNIQSFNRFFKKFEGISPKEFRRI